MEPEVLQSNHMVVLGVDTDIPPTTNNSVGSVIDTAQLKTSSIGRTPETFGWEAGSVSQYDDWSAQSSTCSDGIESFSVMADSAVHAETARKHKMGLALSQLQK